LGEKLIPKQKPLERVREIGAELGGQINFQQQRQLQPAVRSLERPMLPLGASQAKSALPGNHQEHC
jgi:cell filamentation protein